MQDESPEIPPTSLTPVLPPPSADAAEHQNRPPNVAPAERMPSALAGGALLLLGLRGRPTIARALVAAVGGELLYRGLTGRCPLYQALGINTAADDAVDKSHHIVVSRTITIEKPAPDIYQLLLDSPRLADVLAPLAQVTPASDGGQLWRTTSLLGRRFEGEIEVLEDRPGERLQWNPRGQQLPFEAAINLRPTHAGQSTEVTLELRITNSSSSLGWLTRVLPRWLMEVGPRLLAHKTLQRLKRAVLQGESSRNNDAAARSQPSQVSDDGSEALSPNGS